MWDVGCCVCVKCRGEGEFCFVFVSNKRRGVCIYCLLKVLDFQYVKTLVTSN